MSDNQAYISLKEAFEAEMVRRDTIEMNDEIYELKQRGEYLNYLNGFKDAVELLTVGKNNIDINIKLSFTKHNEQRNNLQR